MLKQQAQNPQNLGTANKNVSPMKQRRLKKLLRTAAEENDLYNQTVLILLEYKKTQEEELKLTRSLGKIPVESSKILETVENGDGVVFTFQDEENRTKGDILKDELGGSFEFDGFQNETS